MERLYILVRTSNRPKGFCNLMKSIQKLEWPDVKTIVHTDDPRDTYVHGDIVIYGEAHLRSMGHAPYNLYNNRLLKAIPSPGWAHFIDDDDIYASPDVFNKLLEDASTNNVYVGKVTRWNDQVFPKSWKVQRSFQTECFCVWSEVAKKYKWWSEKGGDHNYTRKITRDHDIRWRDVMIATVQNLDNSKGHGRRMDVDNTEMATYKEIADDEKVYIKLEKPRYGKGTTGVTEMYYFEAKALEKAGYGRITYKGENYVCNF